METTKENQTIKINGNVTYFKTKIDGETTKFNEERNFLSRLIVAAKSRPAILTYASILMTMIISENNMWLFYDNGDLATTKDKYVILQDLTVI